MTVKRKHMSVKNYRRLIRIPAHKRLEDYIRAGWIKRYKVKRLGDEDVRG
jgi:hypothetical protein